MSEPDWRQVEERYSAEEIRIQTRLKEISCRNNSESKEELKKIKELRDIERREAIKRNQDLLKENARPMVVSHNDNQGPPLDYSFKNIESLESLKTEKPRRGTKTYKKGKEGRYDCVSLRLNNNYIESIGGIHSITLDILEVPEKLTWLDLSFNRLTTIPAEITTFSSLKIIYLHGNHLADLAATLRPLKTLSELYSLTLHGNPVEERDNYRLKVISHLPNLKTLDFNKITVADRKKVLSMKKKH